MDSPLQPEPGPATTLRAADQQFPLLWLPVFLVLAALLVLPIGVALLGRDVLSPIGHGFALHAGWFYLGLLGWFVACARRGRLPLSGLMGRPPGWSLLAEGATASLLHLLTNGAVLIVVFGALARWHSPTLERLLERSEKSFQFGETPFALQFVVIAVLAPLTEEMLFRGVVLHRLARKWGTVPGLVWSSLLFGVLHMNPIGIAVFGLLLGALYLRTGSLWACVAAHAFNNAVPLVMMELTSAGRDAGPPSPPELQQMGSQLGFGAIMLVLATWLVWSFLKPRWPERGAATPWSRLTAPPAPLAPGP